jgi:aminoglycoside phosphotransferase (APT) family kinase protein
LSDEPQVRQVCVLLREGRVLTDERGTLPSYASEETWDELGRRVRVCGDPEAVLVAPQVQAGPDRAVVLSVFGSRTETSVDGTWTSLDDLADEDPAVVATLREVAATTAGLLEVPARRPEWFRLAWYDEADAWIDHELAARGRSRTGPTVPVKVWSLSAVLEVPSEPTPVWLKASCRHFHAEPALTRLVADILPEHAPPTIAADDERAWLLMEDVSGADEERTDFDPPHLGGTAARIAATLHLRSLDHLDVIEAAGVPVRGLTDTMHGFDEILVSSAELDQLSRDEVAAVRARRNDVHEVIEELAALGLPDTLVHGDLHPGNIAREGDVLVFYDWSDAAVTHPLLDLAHLTREMPEPERDAACTAYADVWRPAYPDVDFRRGLELATRVDTIYQMVTFEQIYRAQEDASYWEMRGVVARSLRRLPERFPLSGG